MKSGRSRTLRGQIETDGISPLAVGRKNLIVADGLINVGFIVTKFQVWPVDYTDSIFHSILSYDVIPTASQMNAADNRQFAWMQSAASGVTQPRESYLDPDHIINRDLFLTIANSKPGIYNYLIEGHLVSLSDDEAIISIIKETSQS